MDESASGKNCNQRNSQKKSRNRRTLLSVAAREIRRIFSNLLYIFAMIGAPLLCFVFFVTLMGHGLPSKLPAGVVDMDNSANSRNVVRTLGAFQHVNIVAHYRTLGEARDMIQRGKIYGVFYIPSGFSRDLQSSRQPTVSYYSNYAYMIAGTLSFQDFRTMSELAAGSAARSTLRAKGATDEQAQFFLQPIVIDKHPLNNPWLNYSVYLNNVTLPAALMIMIFLVTVYSFGVELKEHTAHEWIRTAGGSIFRAAAGKLLPQSAVFLAMETFYNVLIYGVLHFPCNCGMLTMLLVSGLFVFAAQGVGVFFVGLFPNFRFAMSMASLWGIVSVSMSGFSFPVTAMQPALKALSVCFPLRHYFLLYADQALHGIPLYYSWNEILWLLFFILLPITVLYRLKCVMLTYKYEP